MVAVPQQVQPAAVFLHPLLGSASVCTSHTGLNADSAPSVCRGEGYSLTLQCCCVPWGYSCAGLHLWLSSLPPPSSHHAYLTCPPSHVSMHRSLSIVVQLVTLRGETKRFSYSFMMLMSYLIGILKSDLMICHG